MLFIEELHFPFEYNFTVLVHYFVLVILDLAFLLGEELALLQYKMTKKVYLH